MNYHYKNNTKNNFKRNRRLVPALIAFAVFAAMLLCGCGRKGVEILPEGTASEAEAETSDARKKTASEAKSEMQTGQEEQQSPADRTEDEKTAAENPAEEDKTSESEETASKMAASSKPAQIFVDVCGAVVHPGVYGMSPDSRVFQAIAAAGGLSAEASAASVNQAQPLSDGQQVYVPTTAEVDAGTAPAPGSSASAGAGISDGESKVSLSADGIVNINTADAETLKTLSGIGDAKAAAIIAYREENGGFQTVEDIMQVSGIGESTFSKFKDKITVTNE